MAVRSRRVARLRERPLRLASLLTAALVMGVLVVPTATQVVAPQAAFAQGDEAPGPVTATDEGTASAAAAPQAEESVTPSAAAEPTDTASATAEPTGTPSATAEPTETPSATADPTETPSATATPTQTPTAPTDTPTEPVASPTAPTAEPTAPAPTAFVPTITSDLLDYAPGGIVTLTGLGWQANEVVTVVVNDTGGLSWNLNQKMVADGEGRFTLTFTLPNRYVPDYDVTATGALSGVATTTFTDAANGSWQYWMTAPTPANNGIVNSGATITYVLNAQKTGTGTTSVIGAELTLTLAGTATFTSAGSIDTGDGTVTVTSATTNATTVTWKGMSLDSTAGANIPRSVTVTVTVPASAPAGTVTSVTGTNSDPSAAPNNAAGNLQTTTHTVSGPTVGNCSFATGSGDFSRSICWFNLAGYNQTTAASASGQSMQQNLLNGYVLSYTITATGTGTNVIAKAPPTYSAAFLGNNGAGYINNYQGIAGKPALYQQASGTTTILTLTNISLRDSSGTVVTGFALVGADAESTDSGESITWTSDKVLTSIGPLGNSCGGTLVMSAGNTQAKCNAGPVANKTGAAIMYTLDPNTFSQTMVGSGLQAVAFGVMVSGLQLNKQIVNQISGDQFDISVKRADNTVLGSARTDLTTGYAATDQLYTISSGSSQTFTMSESPVGSADPANYATTWACTKNGAAFTPSGASASIKTADVAMNDFVMCTITNTGPALTLKKSVDNTPGGILTPASWTLTATKSGSAAAITEAPTRSSTTTGKVTTASTATVAVRAGTYALGESSAATGADRYAASAWSCTKAGSGTSTTTAVLAAGDSVTCTITNTYAPSVTIRKTWVNGVAGDKTDLVINNATTSPGKATSTSNGNPGSWADAVSIATAKPAAGSTVSVAEVMQSANRGTYTPAVACLNSSNAVVTLTGGTFTMPNTDVTCDYTNTVMTGTVTWSKVDAGSTSTLLTGSVWTLTGPSYPAPGITVADCASPLCAGPDTDPVAGQFSVPLLAGTYSLVEQTAPIGFQVDVAPRALTIATHGQVLGLGAISNKRSAVPALPLSGGASTDAFLLAGYALIAAAGFAAWRRRRRPLRS